MTALAAQKNPFTRLPLDVIGDILDRVGTIRGVVMVMLTCRSLYQAWSRVKHLTSWEGYPLPSARRMGELHSLVSVNMGFITSTNMDRARWRAIGGLRQLTSVHLDEVEGTYQELKRVLSPLRFIKSLGVPGSNCTVAHLLHMTRLTELDVSHCDCVSEDGFADLIRGLSNLRILDLSYTTAGQTLPRGAFDGLSLVSLNLTYSGLFQGEGEGLDAQDILRNRGLQELSVSADWRPGVPRQMVTGEWSALLNGVGCLTKLKTLSIKNVGLDGFGKLGRILDKLVNLERLELVKTSIGLNEAAVYALAAAIHSMPRLELLAVQGGDLTDRHAKWLVTPVLVRETTGSGTFSLEKNPLITDAFTAWYSNWQGLDNWRLRR